MRKIIVTEFITLDGVVEAPGGNETPHPHGGWESKYSALQKPGSTRLMSFLAWIPCCWAKPRTKCSPRFGLADRINQMPK
jgi:hypothetical protein